MNTLGNNFDKDQNARISVASLINIVALKVKDDIDKADTAHVQNEEL